MVQKFPQGNDKAVAKSYVPNMRYAYDVASKGGVASYVSIPDLTDIAVADSPTCPFPYGAAVVGGGVVRGVDYLGQLVEDDTGTVAFFRVHEADEGAMWSNVFGLPYAYEAGLDTADVTFTPPSADGDHRGTFTAEPTAPGDTVALVYVPIAGNLHGDPYDVPGSGVITALAITEPVDGATLDDPVYTISGVGAEPGTDVVLWSGERDPDVDPPNATTTADDAGNFVFDGSAPAYGVVTWHVVNGDNTSATITVTSPDAPDEGGDGLRDDRDGGSLQVPTRFNSHAESDAWLAENDLPTPDGWGSMTLTDKATLVGKLYGYSSDV